MNRSGAPRRVVVTGMGVVTAIGLEEESVWSALMAGRSGIGEIRAFDVSENDARAGAEIVDLTPLDEHQDGRLRRADRTVRFAVEATRQALSQAGLLGVPPYEPQEIASLWGCGCGPAGALHDAYQRFAEKGPRGARPSTVPTIMANAVSAGVSIHFRLTGSNQVVVSACTSSTNAIGAAFRAIRHGYADQILCGGVDAFFDPFHYGVWNRIGALSTLPDPQRALRPFDIDRAGTLLGEGAGALLLESAESAGRRAARARCELVGYGESSDAVNITAPDAAGQARAIREALEIAGVAPEEVGYINAHGTGTVANDVTESRSIREVFGAAADRIPVGSTKSYFGHTLGASGAIESIATIRGLEEGLVPGNLNLDHADPECRIRLVGREPMAVDAELAMKNSFGFGGGNGVLIFRRTTEQEPNPR